MRTLLVMRHAKSDWSSDYGSDHDRPLNDRGVRSARLMGKVLTAENLTPELVISSTAVRARTTAELANEAGGWNAEIIRDRVLYDGGVDAVVEVVKGARNATRLMVVGHQPTWSMLVRSLTGRSAEMKTATVAAIEFDLDRWSDAMSSPGTLVTVYQPRDFFGGDLDR